MLFRSWTLPAVLTARASTVGSGSGLLVASAGDQGDVPVGTVPALGATASVASAKAVMWTVVVPPA